MSSPTVSPSSRTRASRPDNLIFDLLALEDLDLRPLPVVERKLHLRELLVNANHRLVYVDHVEERGEELLAGARALRLEGVVSKRADSLGNARFPIRFDPAYRILSTALLLVPCDLLHRGRE